MNPSILNLNVIYNRALFLARESHKGWTPGWLADVHFARLSTPCSEGSVSLLEVINIAWKATVVATITSIMLEWAGRWAT